MNKEIWEQYIKIMKRELVPALGCTEPVAVALAAAKSAQLVKECDCIEKIDVSVSRNILKNAMSVIIPGTNLHGLEYAAALGALAGNASKGLEVLTGLKEEDINTVKHFILENRAKLFLEDTPESIYIAVTVYGKVHHAKTVINGEHTNITLVKLDDRILFESHYRADDGHITSDSPEFFSKMSVRDIYDFAVNIPLNDIKFINETLELNCPIAEDGLNNKYGLQLGRKMKQKIDNGVLGKDISNTAIMKCTAAIDARMSGCSLPAMTNSGSGNQGITATVPVWVVATEKGVSEEFLMRALVLSHMIAIYIKMHLDRLSALCGAIAAGIGSSSAITYLLGGDSAAVEKAITNMIANITGIICDGAKASCSLKVSASLQAAFNAAYLALDGFCVTEIEGIVSSNVERTIDNLGKVTSKGMKETDKVILDIMVSK